MSKYGVWVVAEVLALEWKGGRGWIWSCVSEYRVWVVAEVLVLKWKGGRGWGYGRACPNMECGWWLRRWCWNGKG